MEDIKNLASQLFDAVGHKYEILTYKKHRDERRKFYIRKLFHILETTREEINNKEEKELESTLLKIMEHAAEIKKLTK